MSTVKTIKTEVVVLGSGPGGYTAAFRSADLGKQTVLVERFATLGGVCLNVGCIPSKALLHVAKIKEEAEGLSAHGIAFGKPTIESSKIVEWKNKVVNKLTGGLKTMAKMRKVEVVQGVGAFIGSHQLEVQGEEGTVIIEFQNAIIAAGSEAVRLPFIPEDPRIFMSTGALSLKKTDGDLLVLGGGIIGMEMATVYEALGAKIHVVEFMDQLMPGVDKDILKPYAAKVAKRYASIMLKTKVTAVEAKKDGIYVTFEGENAPAKPVRYDHSFGSRRSHAEW